MGEKVKSEGKCLFCGKMCAKAGINRHLANHLKEKEEKASKENAGKSFLVKVTPGRKMDTFPYFLSLWIDGETDIDSLDRFLRDIWLECCWHGSAFWQKISKKKISQSDYYKTLMQLKSQNKLQKFMDEYSYNGDKYEEVSKEDKCKRIFKKGLKLDYDYDMGTTTSLSIMIMEEYQMQADSDIVLLSRNEPMKIMCLSCNELPVTKICTAHWDFNLFCDACAEKHALSCEYYNEMTGKRMSNSPRMGECAYSGGTIDLERDGPYNADK